MNHFDAPWSNSLKVVSVFATLVCVAVSAILWSLPVGGASEPLRVGLGLLPFLILVLSALFTVRGYSLTGDALFIHRLLWRTGVPLGGLKSVAFDPSALRRSIKTFGNGGLFSFTGYFRSTELGSFRAFMTDRSRAVVLRFTDSVIVVSPDRPEDFVAAVRSVGLG